MGVLLFETSAFFGCPARVPHVGYMDPWLCCPFKIGSLRQEWWQYDAGEDVAMCCEFRGFVISGGFSSSGSAGGGLRRVLSDLPPALPSHRWLLAPDYHLLAISLGWQHGPSPLRPPPQVGTLQNDTALSQRDVCGWSQFLGKKTTFKQKHTFDSHTVPWNWADMTSMC